jgi:hypothetical protein
MIGLEIRTTEDGRVQARRKDGLPLTPEDGEQAKKLLEQVSLPPRAWIVDESRSDAGAVRALKIYSTVLKDDLWLIIDRSFIPAADVARYYAEEIPLLGNKTPEQLREIHNAKLAFPGARVIQDGPQ